MIIATPSDESEARLLLQTAYDYEGPSAVRYPRGAGIGNLPGADLGSVEIGQARELRQGHGIAILNFGPHVGAACAVAEKLDLTVIDMRWVKPIDTQAITHAAASHAALVTLEDHAIQGGAGSAVLECLAEQAVEIPVLNLGIPDQYIEGAKPSEMYAHRFGCCRHRNPHSGTLWATDQKDGLSARLWPASTLIVAIFTTTQRHTLHHLDAHAIQRLNLAWIVGHQTYFMNAQLLSHRR